MIYISSIKVPTDESDKIAIKYTYQPEDEFPREMTLSSLEDPRPEFFQAFKELDGIFRQLVDVAEVHEKDSDGKEYVANPLHVTQLDIKQKKKKDVFLLFVGALYSGRLHAWMEIKLPLINKNFFEQPVLDLINTITREAVRYINGETAQGNLFSDGDDGETGAAEDDNGLRVVS